MNFKEENEELFYLIALTLVEGIGAKTARTLLERFGAATRVFKASLKEIKHIEGIGEVKAKAFKDLEIFKIAEKEVDFVNKHKIQVIKYGAVKRLSVCSDAPVLLYYKGNANLDSQKVVAIVGTRKNTDYGMQLCEELIAYLAAQENVLVVSGLALGIDAIAHKKSVQLGVPTVGVLGHGLSKIYPYSNRGLAEQMIDNGGLLTEFYSGTSPDKSNFPMRNRIIAGLSDVTVVIESNVAGGSLITAYMANGYNRDVAAYPGRVTDSRSSGCNELIRKNVASIITKPEDLMELMNWSENKKKSPVQKQLFINFSPEEQSIVNLLQSKDSVHSDEIQHVTGLDNSNLAATLLQLEMQGIIRTLPGKMYRMS